MKPEENSTDGGTRPRRAQPNGDAPEPTPLLTQFTTAMNAAGALVVLGMVIIVNVDVFGRWLANSPLSGTLELTEMGVVAVVYLTVAHAVGSKRLTRSDVLLSFLERRGHNKSSSALRLVFNIAGALIFAIIAWGQVPRVIDAWTRGYFKGNVGIFTAPTWPLEAIMLIGALAAGLQFCVLALRCQQDLRN